MGAGRPKGIAKTGGRLPGSVNKTTATLKEAILLAGEQSGQDGKGKGGLIGYLRRVAGEDMKAFSSLLGRVLPLQVTGEGGGPIKMVHKIEREIIRPGEKV